MFECVIISHGNLAEEFLKTINLIAGDVGQVKTFGLQASDSVDEFKDKIINFLNSINKEVIVFSDLLGGSPMLAVSAELSNLNQRAAVLTGMNLPMIIEVLLQRDNLSFDEAVEIAKNTGIAGIKKIVKEDFNASSTI